jgi:hypothetical protein
MTAAYWNFERSYLSEPPSVLSVFPAAEFFQQVWQLGTSYPVSYEEEKGVVLNTLPSHSLVN